MLSNLTLAALLPRALASIIVCLMLGGTPSSARAEQAPVWLTDSILKALFPTAIYTRPAEGDPPVISVYSSGRKIGYVFATSDLVDVVGFSGAPFTFAIGLNLDGEMIGVELVEHSEPIIDYSALGGTLEHFIDQYAGLNFGSAIGISGGGGKGRIDGISSATVSARAFHHAIVQSARMVARSLNLQAGRGTAAALDTFNFTPLAWDELVASGAVQKLAVRASDLDPSGSSDLVIDLRVALLNPMSIGRSLLGAMRHGSHVATHSPQDLVVLLMANGPYSFVGTEVFRSGVFDRIRIDQGDVQHALPRKLHRYLYLPFVSAAGAPAFQDVGLVRVPANTGIDVLAPWKLVLTIRDDSRLATESTEFSLDYAVPPRFVLPPVAAAAPGVTTPLWRESWHAQAHNMAVLAGALVLLAFALARTHTLTRRPRLYQAFRVGYLLFTLVWIGAIAGAQLSVINPLTWLRAVYERSGWEVLLMDPLLCVLLVFILVSFVAWGRGVFCGWLCPFGALQELLARVARLVSVPQVAPTHRVHQLLWPLKYVVLAGLVAASLHAPATLGVAAEIEPFKTVISLRLDRTWPYVVYALALLLVGLFIERAFCRFLCPLGAIMALGGKLRIFGVLKRRDACGSPCQLCARRCPIQAIEPSGQINMDECFYCLDCQVIYHDVHTCPPLVVEARRGRRTTADATATLASPGGLSVVVR